MNLDKLIINAALTGMVPTKKDNPHVPITVEEIVADARHCRDAGASIVHVHPRDEGGEPTYRREVHAAICAGIRAACLDLIISGTTSGRVYKEFGQRAQVLEWDDDQKPDMASL